MFDNYFEKLFQTKHVTLIVCYDRDCQKNLYDNLYCDLTDINADFYEITLQPDLPISTEQPYDLSADIRQNYVEARRQVNAAGRTFTPEHLLVDLDKIQSYYTQPGHVAELCAQLLKVNEFAQAEGLDIILTIASDEPWTTATTTATGLAKHTTQNDFTIFAMQTKDPTQLTYANGPAVKSNITIF